MLEIFNDLILAHRCGAGGRPHQHDYKRHGTTTLFAALDVKTGKVIGDCMSRHRAREFLKFLRNIDKAVPARRDIHLIVDNYATHKTPEVRAWLDSLVANDAEAERASISATAVCSQWLHGDGVDGGRCLTWQQLCRGRWPWETSDGAIGCGGPRGIVRGRKGLHCRAWGGPRLP